MPISLLLPRNLAFILPNSPVILLGLWQLFLLESFMSSYSSTTSPNVFSFVLSVVAIIGSLP